VAYYKVHSQQLMVGMKNCYRQTRSELRGQASHELLNTTMKHLVTHCWSMQAYLRTF